MTSKLIYVFAVALGGVRCAFERNDDNAYSTVAFLSVIFCLLQRDRVKFQIQLMPANNYLLM